MKIYRNRETIGGSSIQQTREEAAASRAAQVNATDQRLIVALEARQQQTQLQMGDIRRLSPPGLKEVSAGTRVLFETACYVLLLAGDAGPGRG